MCIRDRFIGNDSTDEPAIFFRVVLTDAASRDNYLSDVAGRVVSILFNSIRPIENWGLSPYFSFRSFSPVTTAISLNESDISMCSRTWTKTCITTRIRRAVFGSESIGWRNCPETTRRRGEGGVPVHLPFGILESLRRIASVLANGLDENRHHGQSHGNRRRRRG